MERQNVLPNVHAISSPDKSIRTEDRAVHLAARLQVKQPHLLQDKCACTFCACICMQMHTAGMRVCACIRKCVCMHACERVLMWVEGRGGGGEREGSWEGRGKEERGRKKGRGKRGGDVCTLFSVGGLKCVCARHSLIFSLLPLSASLVYLVECVPQHIGLALARHLHRRPRLIPKNVVMN
jgi:hypothetical protein